METNRKRYQGRMSVVVAAVVAMLGAITLSPPAASAHVQSSRPAIWVGSPVNGTWPKTTWSSPSKHHTFYNGQAYRGDFGLDIQSVAKGTPVYLYAAPNNTSLNSRIEAKVLDVRAGCGSGKISDGGYVVIVGFYKDSTSNPLIGTVKYNHVQPSVRKGQIVGRWGTKIGTVGGGYRYNPNGCWAGTHVHMELTNWHHYACYNRGFRLGQRIYKTNFVGHLGGDYARAAKQPCP